MKPIRICIADDHALIRRGLRMLLTSDARLEVVGEAATAEEALTVVAKFLPDILLLDLSMPGGPFEESLRSLRERHPATKVIVLTMHDDVEYAKAALLGGAAAYLTKGVADSELISTVLAVFEGRTVVNLRSDGRGHELLRPMHRPPKPAPAVQENALSVREREVMQLVAQGFTSAQISAKLFLSVKTIETYRSRLMSKLGLNSRAELVEYVNEQLRPSGSAL